MSNFLDVQPTVENRWRALLLFGRNVATYKFALGRALLELKDRPDDRVPLDELALPYAQAICEHLIRAPKQATSASSRFLDRCRAFNAGEITSDELRDVTIRLGFNNVIDAFHRLGPADLEKRFFIDERAKTNSVRITDELRQLAETRRPEDLILENEARWRLVETAWELGVNRAIIAFDNNTQGLIGASGERRVAVTSCRSALNGYQKGRCFYCFRPIDIEGSGAVADVDHFFPWALRAQVPDYLNQVWNLVLACPACNRGPSGKFDLIPAKPLLERLHRRNEFLIGSHHPLRDTLIAQTGSSTAARVSFLQAAYELAIKTRIGHWAPKEPEDSVF